MTPVEAAPYTFTYAQPGPTSDLSLEFTGTDSGIVDQGTSAHYVLSSGDDLELYDTDGSPSLGSGPPTR